MLSLSRKIKDFIEINGKNYNLNLSFDNVLRLFEMFSDDEIDEVEKIFVALKMLTDNFFYELTIEEAIEVYTYIFEEFIKISKEDPIEYDLLGNPLPKIEREETERVYSLLHDSDYIFASFMQAYKIDLIEEQGKLHWKKFNALLNGLPSNTKFIEVIKIRSWKPSKHDSSEYKEQMRKLQRQYELPEY